MLTRPSTNRQFQQSLAAIRRRELLWPLLRGDRPWQLAIIYLLALTLAEAVTVLVEAQAGVALHMGLLLLILVHAAFTWDEPVHRFLIALALAPLIRIISLSLPLVGFPLVYWYFITSVPLFAAVLVTMRILEMPVLKVSVRPFEIPLQLVVGLVAGILFGFTEYMILRPTPLILGDFNWRLFWIGAAILLVSTGLLEELIFRRIMQDTAVRRLGAHRGIIYVAVIFAILHMGYRSVADLVFVLLVGLMLGYFVDRTGTILGATVAHGVTNIMLFLILPFTLVEQMPLVPQVVETELQALVQTMDELGLGRGNDFVPNLNTGETGWANQVIDPSRFGGERAQGWFEPAPRTAPIETATSSTEEGAAITIDAEMTGTASGAEELPEAADEEAVIDLQSFQSGTRWLLPAVAGQLVLIGLLLAGTVSKRKL